MCFKLVVCLTDGCGQETTDVLHSARNTASCTQQQDDNNEKQAICVLPCRPCADTNPYTLNSSSFLTFFIHFPISYRWLHNNMLTEIPEGLFATTTSLSQL